MTVRFELLSVFRDRTGIDALCLPVSGFTVGQALAALEQGFGRAVLPLLEAGRMKKGVLVFSRNSSGGLVRVSGMQQALTDRQTLVLATAMEGG
jgi:hypothetical protein